MEDNIGNFAILPAAVRYDRELTSTEKLLYAEITALSNKEGFCWASNSYFAELFGCSDKTISTAITKLEKQGHLQRNIIYKDGSKEIEKRVIYPLTKISIPYGNIFPYPMEKNVKDNNIKDNKISLNKEINKEKLSKYGEFKNVCLEEEYYQKLKTTLGEKKLNFAIEKLDAWLDNPKQKNKRNANHRAYFKSNSWVWEGYIEEKNPYASYTAGFSKTATVKPHEEDLSWMED